MYCKKCGAEITEDSIFCFKCGQKQDKKITSNEIKNGTETEQKELPTNETEEKKNAEISFENAQKEIKRESIKETISCGCICTIIFFVSLFLALSITVISSYYPNPPFTRNASIDDLDIDYELDINNLSLDLIIVPECNIKNLKITFTFYDENYNYLFDIEKNFGNVKKGEVVDRQITLFDFDNQIFKADGVKIKVSKGTKSIFE